MAIQFSCHAIVHLHILFEQQTAVLSEMHSASLPKPQLRQDIMSLINNLQCLCGDISQQLSVLCL